MRKVKRNDEFIDDDNLRLCPLNRTQVSVSHVSLLTEPFQGTFLSGFRVHLRTYERGSVAGNVHSCDGVVAFETNSQFAISSFQQIYVISGACDHQPLAWLPSLCWVVLILFIANP